MEQKVKEVMAKIFGVDVSEVADDASPDTIENWDSLRHMNLVVALEEQFDVEFDDEQINQLLNYRLIILTVQELLDTAHLVA